MPFPCSREHALLSLPIGVWHNMSGSLPRKPAAVQAGLWAILIGVLGTLVYTLGSMTAMESHAGKHPQKWKTAAMSAISGCLSWVYYKWAIRDVPGGLGLECTQLGRKLAADPALWASAACCAAACNHVWRTRLRHASEGFHMLSWPVQVRASSPRSVSPAASCACTCATLWWQAEAGPSQRQARSPLACLAAARILWQHRTQMAGGATPPPEMKVSQGAATTKAMPSTSLSLITPWLSPPVLACGQSLPWQPRPWLKGTRLQWSRWVTGVLSRQPVPLCAVKLLCGE